MGVLVWEDSTLYMLIEVNWIRRKRKIKVRRCMYTSQVISLVKQVRI